MYLTCILTNIVGCSICDGVYGCNSELLGYVCIDFLIKLHVWLCVYQHGYKHMRVGIGSRSPFYKRIFVVMYVRQDSVT